MPAKDEYHIPKGSGVVVGIDPDDPNFVLVKMVNRGDGWYWFENGQIQPADPEFVRLAQEKGLLTIEGITQGGTMTGYVRMERA